MGRIKKSRSNRSKHNAKQSLSLRRRKAKLKKIRRRNLTRGKRKRSTRRTRFR